MSHTGGDFELDLKGCQEVWEGRDKAAFQPQEDQGMYRLESTYVQGKEKKESPELDVRDRGRGSGG